MRTRSGHRPRRAARRRHRPSAGTPRCGPCSERCRGRPSRRRTRRGSRRSGASPRARRSAGAGNHTAECESPTSTTRRPSNHPEGVVEHLVAVETRVAVGGVDDRAIPGGGSTAGVNPVASARRRTRGFATRVHEALRGRRASADGSGAAVLDGGTRAARDLGRLPAAAARAARLSAAQGRRRRQARRRRRRSPAATARDAAPNRAGFSIQRVLSHASARMAATVATFFDAVNDPA